jgi:hypothetical protein
MGTAIALKSVPAPQGSSAIVAPAGASHTQAELQMHEPETAGGKTKLGSQQGTIKFQFNPKEVTISKSAKWERKPVKGAKQAGPPEYSGAEPCKMTLEMFFDATTNNGEDVVEAVDNLFRCCVPTDKTVTSKKPMPPLVVFKWGGIESFPAFVTQVQAKYTRFKTDGTPIRAVCTVNLEQIDIPPGKQNPTSGALSPERIHTMVSGDTLALVAYREYGDPALWRPLASYNRIDDPMGIPDGRQLLLPAVDALLTPAG